MPSLEEVLVAGPHAPAKLLAFLTRALERKLEGDGTDYAQVVKEVEAEQSAGEQRAGGPARAEERLRFLVEALSRCTSTLQVRAHSALVKAVISACTKGDEKLLAAVEAFAVNAVSANADVLHPALTALVAKFAEHPLGGVGGLGAAHLAAPSHDAAARPAGVDSTSSSHSSSVSWAPPDAAGEGGGEGGGGGRALAAHRVILRVLEVFPTGTMVLLDILTQAFPHKRKSGKEQTNFTENLLHVTRYVPQLLVDAHALLIDRLLQVDVEIDVERLAEERAVVDREREAAGAGENGVFSMDEDTEVLGGTPGILLPGPSAPLSENALAAEKLEGMLSLSLTFLSGVFTESGAGGAGGQGRMEAEGREAFFNALVDVFCSKVLTTFRPKYTQFVMFVVCSSSERLAKRFLERLITITVETQHADTERHAACSYFGSFLARARYLRLPTIRTSLSLLARWVHDYLERYDANVTAPDPATHCLFYSVVQALLYALCFRVPSLAADAKHAKRDVFLDLRLQHIVLSNLNPLKVVKQTVAAQFVRIAVALRLLDANALAMLQEHNRTLVVAGAAEFDADLSFFPFDPYPFPSFRKFVDPNYTHWDADEDDSVSDLGSQRPSEQSSLEDQDAISLSFRSHLSLSDADHGQHGSPEWRPMSFSPPAGDHFLHHQPQPPTLLHQAIHQSNKSRR